VKRLLVIPAVLVALTFAGCANNNFRDLEGVPSKDPDSAKLWTNVDGHPNVVRLCLDGVAFATTTRDFTALMRVEAWDSMCPGVGK
jgi:hypothetical protein